MKQCLFIVFFRTHSKMHIYMACHINTGTDLWTQSRTHRISSGSYGQGKLSHEQPTKRKQKWSNTFITSHIKRVPLKLSSFKDLKSDKCPELFTFVSAGQRHGRVKEGDHLHSAKKTKSHKAVQDGRAEQMITHIVRKRFWTVIYCWGSLDIQSSNFKIPQQSKSSNIVYLFKVIIHRRCVHSEKKKRDKKTLWKMEWEPEDPKKS